MSGCRKVGCLQTQNNFVTLSLYVPVPKRRGRIRRWEEGGNKVGFRSLGSSDGEWRRGSPDSLVCSLMQTLPPEI